MYTNNGGSATQYLLSRHRGDECVCGNARAGQTWSYAVSIKLREIGIG